MKSNIPKIIYLQVGEDVAEHELKDLDFTKGGITWCWDKINDNDIEYINKADLIKESDAQRLTAELLYGKDREEEYEAYCSAIDLIIKLIKEKNNGILYNRRILE